MTYLGKSSESNGWSRLINPLRCGLVTVIMGLGSWTGNAALADNVKILDATTEAQVNGLYAFSVTLQHPDEGWGHYADKWEVVSAAGQVLGERILFHPHENNVPFTRSLANVKIPIGEVKVSIRANCSVDGLTPYTRTVDLPPR